MPFLLPRSRRQICWKAHERRGSGRFALLVSNTAYIEGMTLWIDVIINGAERVIKTRRGISALLLDQHSLRIDNVRLTANNFKHANVTIASTIDFLGHNIMCPSLLHMLCAVEALLVCEC